MNMSMPEQEDGGGARKTEEQTSSLPASHLAAATFQACRTQDHISPTLALMESSKYSLHPFHVQAVSVNLF